MYTSLWENKMSYTKLLLPIFPKNAQTLNFFFLYFQVITPVTVQETNCYQRVYNPCWLYGSEYQNTRQLQHKQKSLEMDEKVILSFIKPHGNPHKSCGVSTTHLKFMEQLVRHLIVLLWKAYWTVWYVMGPTQHFRDYSQPTCSKIFLALASHKKSALLLCVKWKSKYYCTMCQCSM
jgi:hypothetical protein